MNGVITVPVMAAMMIVAARRSEMGAFVATPLQLFFGWLTTAIMAAAAMAMVVLL